MIAVIIICIFKVPLQAIQFCQTVLIQPIQFSISIDFVYTQLNFKTVPLKKNSLTLG